MAFPKGDANRATYTFRDCVAYGYYSGADRRHAYGYGNPDSHGDIYSDACANAFGLIYGNCDRNRSSDANSNSRRGNAKHEAVDVGNDLVIDRGS